MRRFYRDFVKSDLETFEVAYKETDLFIETCKDMRVEVFSLIRRLRLELDRYIELNRAFLTSLEPIPFDEKAPKIAKVMIKAARDAGVGPMACVAGAFAEMVGRFLLESCKECVVENGGDVFLRLARKAVIGVYTENRFFKDRIKLKLEASDKPYGICASSAKIGPSLSMGKADLALIVAHDAALADGLATKCANMIVEKDDIGNAIEFAKSKDVIGCLFIKDDRMGLWGSLEMV